MIRSWLLFTLCAALFGLSPVAQAEGAPSAAPTLGGYDAQADAKADIDAALARAAQADRAALLIFGADWCHDSRGLASALAGEGRLAALLAAHYEPVLIDIGLRHRNIDQMQRFGVAEPFGTPTVLIVDGQGVLLNAATVHDWRAVDDAAPSDLEAYLRRLSGTPAELPVAIASVDVAAVAESWASLQDARAVIAERRAAGEISAEEAQRDEAYALGMARSLTRRAMGRLAAERRIEIAAVADLSALGVMVSEDLTEAVSAHLNDIEINIPRRIQRSRRETARALGAGP
ncbi:MAG: thioredoxin family protein [Pseudomonadota bacterium]